MQGLAVGLRAPSVSRLLGHHVPTLRRSVSVRPLFVLTPLLLVARRSSPLESRDSSMYVQSFVLKKCIWTIPAIRVLDNLPEGARLTQRRITVFAVSSVAC